jgi:glycosyltransferase involved in cell wall biosynthesis
MRVFAYPADQGGCGRYRVIWPAQALQAQGLDVVIAPAEGKIPALMVDQEESVRVGPEPWMLKRRKVGRVVGVEMLDCDVVVLQRPLQRDLVDAIPHIQRQGVAVVVEVDDDFTCIPPGNPAFKHCHPTANPERNWHHLMRAIRMADLVTVSTPALAIRYGHPRTRVLRNCVPESFLKVQREAVLEANSWEPGLRVGWTGTPSTHQNDLEEMGDIGSHLGGATFRAVGSKATLAQLGVEGEVLEWIENPDRYAQAVASLDVGLAPLKDTAFNRAKSWLKPLEYAALGVAFLCSPLLEYSDLARLLGSLAVEPTCRKPREWGRKLHMVIEDDKTRQEMQEAGRAAAENLTYERRCHQWAEAWQEAHRVRAEKAVAV